ncbi:MAG: hypothetical protein KDK07_14795 [Bauldia sp.]|nr:hypothetical protein [Bauldia sp.]
MSDFYSVLKQSIIDRRLDSPEARDAAYAQARRAMINRLWSLDPPLAEDEIDHRIGQFDTAVARIEDEVIEVFATMDLDDPPGGDDGAFILAPDGEDFDEAGEAPRPTAAAPRLPQTRATALRGLDERSRAIEQALLEAETAENDTDFGRAGAYDEDVGGLTPYASDPIDARGGYAGGAEVVAPPRRTPPTTGRQRPASRSKPARRGATGTTTAGVLATVRSAINDLVPKSHAGQLRLLVGVVAVLVLLLAGGLAFVLLPRTVAPAAPSIVLQTDVPGGVSDPDTAIRLPKAAVTVTSSFSLFDGRDPTVFGSDSDNPVRFDGELARIATSVASAGAKVIIGAGLSSRLSGKIVRVTIDARSARENGASSMRFAYQSGVAISHWQTANLSPDFTELGLVWRVPALRTDPNGDYIVIEPGVPGSGTGVEIRSVRIDLIDQ